MPWIYSNALSFYSNALLFYSEKKNLIHISKRYLFREAYGRKYHNDGHFLAKLVFKVSRRVDLFLAVLKPASVFAKNLPSGGGLCRHRIKIILDETFISLCPVLYITRTGFRYAYLNFSEITRAKNASHCHCSFHPENCAQNSN